MKATKKQPKRKKRANPVLLHDMAGRKWRANELAALGRAVRGY